MTVLLLSRSTKNTLAIEEKRPKTKMMLSSVL